MLGRRRTVGPRGPRDGRTRGKGQRGGGRRNVNPKPCGRATKGLGGGRYRAD